MTLGSEADYLLALAEAQGVACTTVNDGHLLVFKREHLKRIIDAHPDTPNLVIFIKRQMPPSPDDVQ